MNAVIGIERTRRFADSRRIHAMRLVSEILTYTGTARSYTQGVLKVQDLFPPKPSEWSFIDMDPLHARDEWFALADDGKFDAQWPIDFAIAFPMDSEAGGSRPNGDWRIAYAKTIRAKDVRKVATIFSPKMMAIGNLDYVNGRHPWGSSVISQLGSKWVHAIPTRHKIDGDGLMSGVWRQGAENENLSISAGLMIGAALRHRYEWSVILNFPSIRARFSTDASGALKMFRDRNLEAGANRRSPLLHWVANHWRMQRTVPEDMIEVRKHLRGRSDFDWRGFPVTIIPAEFEIEQALRETAA